MKARENISWSALEYEHRERSSDWYWALGIIVVAFFGAALIYGNYFFAVLILLSGLLLGFFASKPPENVHYELGESGLQIRDRLYPYENIKSFWIQLSSAKGGSRPTLFIKSERIFMPVIGIPIEDGWADEMTEVLKSKNILEEEMTEHPSEKIMEFFGF